MRVVGKGRHTRGLSFTPDVPPERLRWQTAKKRAGILKRSGFTLIELLMAVIVISLITVIAVPSYQSHVNRARNAQAVADIAMIDMQIERFRSTNFSLPPNLTALSMTLPVDPWGNAYRYLNIQDGGPGVQGAARKDRNLVPINTDYDLYSMGADGKTASPLVSKPARDDIVRAWNGSFIGLARDF